MRVVEESFRRNAADVQAGSAQRASFLDTCDLLYRSEMPPERYSALFEAYLHALLASFDGSDIASNTASNDDQILLLCTILACNPSLLSRTD
jgi:hypothetical protein